MLQRFFRSQIRVMLTFFLILASILASTLTLKAIISSATGVYHVGPKAHYLALGDSLAFGFQPNFDFDQGYADLLFSHLQTKGVESRINLGCPGETSNTMINGPCPTPLYLLNTKQLHLAMTYLHVNAGTVSPVTLDIGANDLLPDAKDCKLDENKFMADLATLDDNLVHTILPQLHAALTINGVATGDLAMMNYYDPTQNDCPNLVPYTQLLNAHLARDIRPFGTIVDVFDAFGGARTPNPHICVYTWMCSKYHDIHATNEGYKVIAEAFKTSLGY